MYSCKDHEKDMMRAPSPQHAVDLGLNAYLSNIVVAKYANDMFFNIEDANSRTLC